MHRGDRLERKQQRSQALRRPSERIDNKLDRVGGEVALGQRRKDVNMPAGVVNELNDLCYQRGMAATKPTYVASPSKG